MVTGLEEPCPPRSRTTCDWDIDILWRLRAAGPLPQQRCPNVAPVQSRLGANSLTWPFKWHLTHWMHWRNVWRLGRLGEDRWRAISVLRRKRLDCWIHNSQICSCSHTASSRSISCLVADAKLKAMCLPELISGRCNVYIYIINYVMYFFPSRALSPQIVANNHINGWSLSIGEHKQRKNLIPPPWAFLQPMNDAPRKLQCKRCRTWPAWPMFRGMCWCPLSCDGMLQMRYPDGIWPSTVVEFTKTVWWLSDTVGS